jgi:hypothetical protein
MLEWKYLIWIVKKVTYYLLLCIKYLIILFAKVEIFLINLIVGIIPPIPILKEIMLGVGWILKALLCFICELLTTLIDKALERLE